MSGKRDSNSRPQPWQGCALPTELFPQSDRLSKSVFAGANITLILESATMAAYFFAAPAVRSGGPEIVAGATKMLTFVTFSTFGIDFPKKNDNAYAETKPATEITTEDVAPADSGGQAARTADGTT